MGLEKAKHLAEEVEGKVTETAGQLTGDEKQEAEGKARKAAAHLKQAGDDVKDAFSG
ncbi:CsbD family protein [Isoptericola sp. BMS4]|uniref:CsbD family protein n=1 Tax=Isoptericola sp. BMS4 TaxID=2527875 RepID=UPI0014231DD8|nr:CsbD family protein [Isoptericola sp. BMS4]